MAKRLMKLLLVKDVRTLQDYIKKGLIPKPVSDGNGLCFGKKDIAERLGVKNLNEPFIDSATAAEILEISKQTLVQYAELDYVSNHRLIPGRGRKFLFRKSEIKKARIEISSGFSNLKKLLAYIGNLMNDLLNTKIVSGMLNPGEKAVLRSVFVERKTKKDIAEERGIGRTRVGQIFAKAVAKLKTLPVKIERIEQSSAVLRTENSILRKENERLKKEVVSEIVRIGVKEREKQLAKREKTNVILTWPIEELNLSARALHYLKKCGIETIGNLVNCTASYLLKIKNFGRKSLADVEDALFEKGLSLKK